MISFLEFLPDPAATAKIMAQQSTLDYFQRITDQVVDAAKALAPVETGAYQDSISGVVGIEDGALVARVNAFDYKAWWIEAGTEDTPAFAPLARGAESAGLHVEAETGRHSAPGHR